jgi:hypothetical protein
MARSPEYPAVGLREATGKIQQLYEAIGASSRSRDEAATLIGYSGINGTSLTMLSALSKFGLLEGRKEVRVSELAKNIIRNGIGSPQRVAAIKQAAEKPPLFSEIGSRFEEGWEVDDLRDWLRSKNYISNAASKAVYAYLETKDFLMTEESLMPKNHAIAAESGRFAVSGADAELRVTRQVIIALDEGDVKITFPESLSTASILDLKQHLELFINRFQRQIASGKEA